MEIKNISSLLIKLENICQKLSKKSTNQV